MRRLDKKRRHSRSICQRPRGKIGIIVARDEEGGEEEKIIDRVNPVGTSLSAIRGRAATATAAEDDGDNDAATTTTAVESEERGGGMAKAPMTDESSLTSGPILGRMPSLTQHAAFKSVLPWICGPVWLSAKLKDDPAPPREQGSSLPNTMSVEEEQHFLHSLSCAGEDGGRRWVLRNGRVNHQRVARGLGKDDPPFHVDTYNR